MNTIFLTSEPFPAAKPVPPPVNLSLRQINSSLVGWSFDAPAGAPEGAEYRYELWKRGRRVYSGTVPMVSGTASGSFRVLKPGVHAVKAATKIIDSDGNEKWSAFVAESITM